MLQAKSLGKPYAGKPHVRFDEGVKEVKVRKCGTDPFPLASFILLYCLLCVLCDIGFLN